MAVTISEYTDRELLWALLDATEVPDENGDTPAGLTTTQLVETLSLEGKNVIQCAGARLAWLKRYGMVDRSGHLWHVTDEARISLLGPVRSSTNAAVEGAREGELFALQGTLSKRYMNTGDLIATGMRRENAYWQKQRRVKKQNYA